MLSGPRSTLPLTSTVVRPENGPIAPGGKVNAYLFVEPSYVIASFLTLAKLLVDVDDLLNPAIWINVPAFGAVLNVTVIVLAEVDVVSAVVGTPSTVT